MSLLEIAFRVAPLVPDSLLGSLAGPLADLDRALSPARREGLRANLDAIAAWGHPALATSGSRRAAERAVFRAYYRSFLAYLAHRREAVRGEPRVRFSGAERLYRALAAGRGAVVTMPHIGRWELAGLALARLGFRLHVVTGVQFHAAVSASARAAKTAARIAVSTPEDGFVPLLETLRRGGLVVLLADGDVYRRGLPARLFGAEAMLPAGPAILARRANAPIVHALTRRDEAGNERMIVESVDWPDRGRPVAEDVERLTGGVARSLERAIAAHVTEWCIFRPMLDEPARAAARAGGVTTHAA